MSVERENQPWVTIAEVRRVLRRAKSLSQPQLSGLLDGFDKLSSNKGFRWNQFLQELEDITRHVDSPFPITKNKSLERRTIELHYRVEHLVDFYSNPIFDLDDYQDDDQEAKTMASIVNVTMESISGRNFLDLNPLQKSALLDDLKKYGFHLFSADLRKSPEYSEG